MMTGAWDFALGEGSKAERQRRDNRGAESDEGGWGGGVSLPTD